MKRVLLTENKERVIIDMKNDDCLYSAPVNPPNTGTTYTRGTDLYAHTAQSGKVYYYAYSWSIWQGEESQINLLTKEEAEEFLIDKLSLTGYGLLDEDEAKRISDKYGLELLTETA